MGGVPRGGPRGRIGFMLGELRRKRTQTEKWKKNGEAYDDMNPVHDAHLEPRPGVDDVRADDVAALELERDDAALD